MMFGSMATRSPTARCETEGCTARMTPADSWPRMCVSVTIMGPIQPACQKWTSDLGFFVSDAFSLRISFVSLDCIVTYPQIPVLLIPTVTSPTFKVFPFSTSSRDGTASATQRSWAGFV